LYASWGVDYLKYDWCNSEGLNPEESYRKMSEALRKAGRPVVFSLCEWGTSKPWLWAAPVGHLWRTTGDIGNVFDGFKQYPTWHSNGVLTIVDLNEPLYPYAGPGHWNDPDMLEVGNGQSSAEDRSHFSLWCMMAAPLMAGNDLRNMSKETLAVLTNKDAIAIDQDSLGAQGFRYSNSDSLQVWFKPLLNGDWAVCFVNRSGNEKQIQFNWQQARINDPVHKRAFDASRLPYKIYNAWSHRGQGNTRQALKWPLGAHDVLLLKLSRH
jgi:alpha-galactosidase